jgi:oxepin-CoA hydrolase/3-oxo-5,6-dehydrosuberyl-CoA semialdehyde dehydrogenase
MQNIQSSLENLIEQSERKFGIMSPQHMVEHLILTVKLSYGRIKLPEFEPTEKQLKQKHALIHTDLEFPKGVKAPGLGENLLDLKFPDLNSAKSELVKSINDYLVFFGNNPNELTIHLRFGKLTFSEWELFHEKHFEHHLGQFGV